MSRNATIDDGITMAAREPPTIARADVPYIDRDLPLTFFGVKHSRWQKGDMVTIIETLGGAATVNDTRLDLYQTIHRRYNPHRITQRAINTLEELALAAAGQGGRSQNQVREAAQQAGAERADLAREKRTAARLPRGAPVITQNHEPEIQRTRRIHDLWPAPGLNTPIPTTATQPVHLVDNDGRGTPRKRGRENVAEQPAKRRRIDPTEGAGVEKLEQLANIFGTSPAIQETNAFRHSLDLAHFPAQNRRSCQVCSDDMDPLLSFQVTVATQCNHEPEICLTCWEQHIASQADFMTWDSITCPHADCKATLNHDDMRRFAPAAIYSRYDEFQTNRVLQATPGFRPCAHEGCKSGTVVDTESDATSLTCRDCNRSTCLRCNLVYHPGQTCDEYRQWLADAPRRDRRKQQAEEKSKKYLDQKAKTCPNASCGARIQKTQGCDHMTCTHHFPPPSAPSFFSTIRPHSHSPSPNSHSY